METEHRGTSQDVDVIAKKLIDWEAEVLIADHFGPTKPWGAAVGAALEVLQSRGLIGTELGRRVAQQCRYDILCKTVLAYDEARRECANDEPLHRTLYERMLRAAGGTP